MIESNVIIPRVIYKRIHKYLIPKLMDVENVAFIFTEVLKENKNIQLKFKSWYAVKPDEYKYRSRHYVELKDEMRPKIIKMAFDLNAAIIELHSHLSDKRVRFSPSGIEGFGEFVPHVLWRLKGKPYTAIVFSKKAFDGLIWIDDARKPNQLTKISVGRISLYSNGYTLTYNYKGNKYES